MGYYLRTLIQGARYELDGQNLEFSQKVGKMYYFYRYAYDENTFSYNKTDCLIGFTIKELSYLRRVQDCTDFGSLTKIGRDRVWQRN